MTIIPLIKNNKVIVINSKTREEVDNIYINACEKWHDSLKDENYIIFGCTIKVDIKDMPFLKIKDGNVILKDIIESVNL